MSSTKSILASLVFDVVRTGLVLGVILLLLGGIFWFVVLVPFANEMVAGDTTFTNLKQLALAMHSYRDVHGTLPPQAIYSKEGKPLLSWRVLVLPYIEQDALFSEFRLGEPWDSPHNIKLLPKMPVHYTSWSRSSTADWGMAFYRVFVGKRAAFEGTRGLRLEFDFPDGEASTILIVETAEPVPWTKPEDLSYAQDRPLPKLPERFYAAFVDGTIRHFKAPSEATVRAAITRNGSEKVNFDW